MSRRDDTPQSPRTTVSAPPEFLKEMARELQPAFPGLNDHQAGNTLWHSSGMTLRDYFAAKAMHAELNTAGMLTGPAEALAEAAELAGRTAEEQIAFNAYSLADAMLKERAK